MQANERSAWPGSGGERGGAGGVGRGPGLRAVVRRVGPGPVGGAGGAGWGVGPGWGAGPAAAGAGVAILIGGWWGAALRGSGDSARYAVQTGNDFAEDCWRDSPLAAWVRANGSGHMSGRPDGP